jgi:hypothetical protein
MSVSDPRQIRALLGAAHGYAVLDRQRRRIGAFAELADDDRIVIRHDGVFVWHRRLLPITTVADVIPDQRAVVLTVDKRTLVDTETASNPAPGSTVMAEESPRPSGAWQDRVNRYVGSVEQDEPTANEGGDSQRTGEQHLLFVSTPRGYSLLEREGPPPPVGGRIEMPEQAVSSFVIKLATSPLPNDSRPCAYLQPTA